MNPADHRNEAEGWTGEQDIVAAVALAVCLGVAGLIFLLIAAADLHH